MKFIDFIILLGPREHNESYKLPLDRAMPNAATHINYLIHIKAHDFLICALRHQYMHKLAANFNNKLVGFYEKESVET